VIPQDNEISAVWDQRCCFDCRDYTASNDGEDDLVQWRTERGEGLGCSGTPPEIPKTLQNRAKLNPIVKTVKNCRI